MKRGKISFLSAILCFSLIFCSTPIMPGVVNAQDAYFIGSGTVEDPYLISSADDLVQLSNLVNDGIGNYSSKNYRISNDIDLSYIENWIPIGYPYNFQGSLDGNGYSIRSLRIDAYIPDGSIGYYGLFGQISYSKITNLKLVNVSINLDVIGSFQGATGGIVGIAGNSEVTNCEVTGSVQGGLTTGGIVGYLQHEAEINNCTNNASVSGFGERPLGYLTGGVAGIAGESWISNINYSTNHGDIIGNAGGVGGIVGNIGGVGWSISNCWNQGAIEGNSYVGGISGMNNQSTITISHNDGEITGSAQVGGICGRNSNGTITGCYNKGSVLSSGNAGGIVSLEWGIYEKTYGIIEDSYNVGVVSGSYRAGGILGSFNENLSELESVIKNTYNYGLVNNGETPRENAVAGGIVGAIRLDSSLQIQNCYFLNNIDLGIGEKSDEHEDTTVICGYEEMMSHTTYGGFDFDSVWMMTDELIYTPVLRENYVSLIDIGLKNTVIVTGAKDNVLLLIPENPTVLFDYSWGNYDDSIIHVDKNGDVTGLSVGISNMDGSSLQTGYFGSCTIEVMQGVIAIDIPSEIEVYAGDTTQIIATVLPEDAYNKGLIWTSSDQTIAQVDQSGRITGLRGGVTTITATAMDGSGVTVHCSCTILQCVTGIQFIDPFQTINIGQSKTLEVQILPLDATDKNLSWQSTDTTIAQVDSQGLVTGIAKGSVQITATTNDGGFIVTTPIEVIQQVNEVELNKGDMILDVNSSEQLFATVLPSDANNQNVSWESNNPSVASVDDQGIVTGVKRGVAVIKVATDEGNYTAYCNVEIRQPVTGILLDRNELKIALTKKIQLTATIIPTDANNKKVIWSSLDFSIADVDATGIVSGVAEGTTQITARTEDGNFTAHCDVQVGIGVEGITIIGADKVELDRDALYDVEILPIDAINQEVKWIIIPGTGSGYVSSLGVLTGTSLGNLILRARATDGTGVYCDKEIEIIDHVVSIEISVFPTKTHYLYGDELDVTGGIIKVTKASGATLDITMTDQMVSGYDPLLIGTQDLLVTYEGATSSYQITLTREHTISVSAREGGTVDPSGNICVIHGDLATLTATANPGYHFVNWTEGAEEVSTSAEYSFTAEADRILVAHFALNNYGISASADPVAGGSISGAGTYSHGDSVTLTATPNSGYYFANWTEDGTMVSTASSYGFTANQDRILVARFATSVFTINATSDPIHGGFITGTGNYEFGSTVTLVAQPNSGYQFIRWTEGSMEVSTDAEYSFAADSNRSLIAHFGIKEYVVSAASVPPVGGNVSGGGTYSHGDSVELSAAANQGFSFLGWKENGTYFSSENLLSFIAESNRTLEAVFSPVVPGKQTLVVIPEGGEEILEYPDMDIAMHITTDNTGIVSVTQYSEGDMITPLGQLSNGVYLDISLSDSLSGSNVRIEVGYDPALLPVEVDESALRIWHYDELTESWTALPGGVDTERHIIWGETSEFSTFGIFGSYKTVTRLAGSNRYQTAVGVSQAGWFGEADTIILARGDNYADALAGVPLAYLLDAPILLTSPTAIGTTTLTEIERLGAEKVILLGGPGAISDAVANTLTGKGLTVERIAGTNRYHTAVLIAQEMVKYGAEIDTAVIAVGTNFPDALAAASYAAMSGQPILLTGTQTLSGNTAEALETMNITNTIIVGGTGVISQAVEDTLAQYGSVLRISGANRYETAVMIAQHYNCDTGRYYIATGINFPDAITGAVLAAKRGTGVLLVYGPGTVPNPVVQNYVATEMAQSVGLFGGSSVISDGIVSWFENNL